MLSVLDKKRNHGKIVLSDFMPNGSDAEIIVFEMLPRYPFRLRQMVRKTADKYGYKHVWVSNSTVLVRKNIKSETVPIITENDLENIK